MGYQFLKLFRGRNTSRMKIFLGLVLMTIGFEVANGGKLLKKLNKQLGFLEKIVVENRANIASNAADLEANILDIKADISNNVDGISKNDEAISSNAAIISNQDRLLGAKIFFPYGNFGRFVNTTKTNINTLFGLHNDNAAGISTNGDSIVNISSNIEALNATVENNNAAIATNLGNIGALNTEVFNNSANIASNMVKIQNNTDMIQAYHPITTKTTTTTTKTTTTTTKPKIDCQWSGWSSWSSCSRSCGSGSQSRSRSKLTVEAYGGTCSGSSYMTRNCNTHNCPT